MPRKITTYIVFVSFINLFGCYSFVNISYNEFEDDRKNDNPPKELFINISDHSRYHCSGELFWVEQDSIKIKGAIVLNDYEKPFTGKFAIKDIESIEVKSLDEEMTILLTGFLIGCVVLLAIMNWEIRVM